MSGSRAQVLFPPQALYEGERSPTGPTAELLAAHPTWSHSGKILGPVLMRGFLIG